MGHIAVAGTVLLCIPAPAAGVDVSETPMTVQHMAAGKDELMIHYTGAFGDWLALKGVQKNGTEYFTGNLLTAVEMTNVNTGAGLYAPLRIMVYENAQGATTIEYDKPSSLLNQFHSAAIDVQGRSLDVRLAKLCNAVLQ